MAHSDTTFLKYAKKQYKVWKNSYVKQNKKYSDKIKKINESFKLKDTWWFNTKLSPKFWAGDIDKHPKFIVVSLNPGLGDKIHYSHMESDAQGWKEYKENRKSWFKNRKDFQKSPYWKQVNKLVCGMDGITPGKKIDADYITENVLNLNLFPYHSKETKQYSETFNVKELKIIIENLDLLFDLIKSKNPDYCFFSGKVWETLLIDYKLFSRKFKKKKYKPKKKKAKKRKNKFRIYFLKQNKIKYVVLNRFFVRAMGGEGITSNDLIYGIPKFIKKHS